MTAGHYHEYTLPSIGGISSTGIQSAFPELQAEEPVNLYVRHAIGALLRMGGEPAVTGSVWAAVLALRSKPVFQLVATASGSSK
jgi:hypothetical protein